VFNYSSLQVPTFLSTVGPATYAILRDLFAPVLPSSVPLTDIFERLKKHYKPKRAIIVGLLLVLSCTYLVISVSCASTFLMLCFLYK